MDKEALVRAYDAMQSKDGMLRDVSSALAITSQERLYLIQVRKHSNGLPRSRGCCDTHRVPNEALRRPGAQRRVTRSALLRCRIHWSRQRMRRCQKAGMNRRVCILVSQALSVWCVPSPRSPPQLSAPVRCLEEPSSAQTIFGSIQACHGELCQTTCSLRYA